MTRSPQSRFLAEHISQGAVAVLVQKVALAALQILVGQVGHLRSKEANCFLREEDEFRDNILLTMSRHSLLAALASQSPLGTVKSLLLTLLIDLMRTGEFLSEGLTSASGSAAIQRSRSLCPCRSMKKTPHLNWGPIQWKFFGLSFGFKNKPLEFCLEIPYTKEVFKNV